MFFGSNKSKRIYFELWMWYLISWQMRIKTVEILSKTSKKIFFDGSAVQNKYESFHIFPFMSFPPTGMLRFLNGLLSIWLDRIERCVLPSHTSVFDSQSGLKFFRFFFNRLGCLFNCEIISTYICDPPQDFNAKTKEFILTRFSTLAKILPH